EEPSWLGPSLGPIVPHAILDPNGGRALAGSWDHRGLRARADGHWAAVLEAANYHGALLHGQTLGAFVGRGYVVLHRHDHQRDVHRVSRSGVCQGLVAA